MSNNDAHQFKILFLSYFNITFASSEQFLVFNLRRTNTTRELKLLFSVVVELLLFCPGEVGGPIQTSSPESCALQLLSYACEITLDIDTLLDHGDGT